jgi:hypothetical protein
MGVWKEDAPWMTVYFCFAVWSSLWLAQAEALVEAQAGRALLLGLDEAPDYSPQQLRRRFMSPS